MRRRWTLPIVLVAYGVLVFAAVPPPSAAAGTLSADLSSYLAGRRDTVSVGVFDERTKQAAWFRPSGRYDNASIVKVNILQTLLWRAQRAGRGLTPWEQSQAVPMIRQSDNSAATALWNHVGGRSGVAAYDRTLGLTGTTFDPAGRWGLTQSVVADQLKLVEAVHAGPGPLTPSSRAYVRYQMAHVVPDQRWGISAGVPAGGVLEVKNGWLPRQTHGWRVNSIGHVDAGGRRYDIAVLTTDNGSMAYGMETISAVSRLVYRDLAYVPPKPTPSPTPKPSPTPTASPTATPTSSPSPTPTSSPTPKPTPSGTPSPTAST